MLLLTTLHFPLQKVSGEIFDVDDEMLQRLDKLENHPHLYERQYIDIEVANKDATANPVRCWTYLFSKFKPEMLTLPFMHKYEGGILSKYIPRGDRTKDPFVEVVLL